MLGALIGKSLAVKLAAGFAAATVAGTGFAAETGTLPAPVQRAAHEVAGDLGVPAPRDTVDEPTTAPTDEPEPGTTPGTTPSENPEPSESPEPGVEPDDGPDASGPAAGGLCQAYRSGANRDSAAQRALADAAGGPDNVAAYCDGVLADRDAKHDGRQPGQTSSAGSGKGTTGSGKSGSGKGTSGSNKGSDKSTDKSAGKGGDKSAGKGGDKSAGKGKNGS